MAQKHLDLQKVINVHVNIEKAYTIKKDINIFSLKKALNSQYNMIFFKYYVFQLFSFWREDFVHV